MKQCDVLLINPPATSAIMPQDQRIIDYFNCISRLDFLGDSDIEPNYGLFSIAAYLKKECAPIRRKLKKSTLTIEYVDLNLYDQNLRAKEKRPINKTDIEKIISGYNCYIAGISFMTVSYGTWAEIIIDEVYKRSNYIFLGGIHPTVRYREIFEKFPAQINGIIIGEGERVFFEIVHEILHNGNNLERIEHLCTIKKVEEDPNVKISPARLDGSFLGNLPNPDYGLLYKQNQEIIARVYSSRGCINDCSICSVGSFFHADCFADPALIDVNILVKKIGELYDQNKIKHFVLGDLDISDKPRLKKFLNGLILLNKQKNIKKDWWCQTRGDSDIIDDTTAKLLKGAGFKQIAIGCEGATDEQLQTINKNEYVSSVKNALTILTQDAGLSTQGYWIIGLPYDDEEKVRKTQKKILEYLEAGIVTVPHITVLVPYPNTELMKNENTNGIRIINWDYKDYWMNCDLYGCGKPVYETIDQSGNTLLTSDQIYTLWIDTLQKVTEFYNNRRKTS